MSTLRVEGGEMSVNVETSRRNSSEGKASQPIDRSSPHPVHRRHKTFINTCPHFIKPKPRELNLSVTLSITLFASFCSWCTCLFRRIAKVNYLRSWIHRWSAAWGGRVGEKTKEKKTKKYEITIATSLRSKMRRENFNERLHNKHNIASNFLIDSRRESGKKLKECASAFILSNLSFWVCVCVLKSLLCALRRFLCLLLLFFFFVSVIAFFMQFISSKKAENDRLKLIIFRASSFITWMEWRQ